MSAWKPLATVPGSGSPPLLILDRDGVVIREQDYLDDPAQVELIGDAGRALARARAAGWLILGVSNQSGIGRGRFTTEVFAAVMRRMDQLLAEEGAAFDGFYFCPHAPEQACGCRKPAPGLLAEAGLLAGLPGRRAVVIGDKPSDIALGRNLGLGAVLVMTGYGSGSVAEVGRRWPADPLVRVAADLNAAIDLVLGNGFAAGGGK